MKITKKWYGEREQYGTRDMSSIVPEGVYGFRFGNIIKDGVSPNASGAMIGTNRWVFVKLEVYKSADNNKSAEGQTLTFILSGKYNKIDGTTDQFRPNFAFSLMQDTYAPIGGEFDDVVDFYKKYMQGRFIKGALTWKVGKDGKKNANYVWDQEWMAQEAVKLNTAEPVQTPQPQVEPVQTPQQSPTAQEMPQTNETIDNDSFTD